MCERECICKKCRFSCADCDHMEIDECRSGGMNRCKYMKKLPILFRIINKLINQSKY